MDPTKWEVGKRLVELFAYPDWPLLYEQAAVLKSGFGLGSSYLLPSIRPVATGKVTCPQCGHQTSRHSYNGCSFWEGNNPCTCTQTGEQLHAGVELTTVYASAHCQAVMKELKPTAVGLKVCPNGSCGHLRTSHSSNGCLEWLPDNTECKCTKKYMDLRIDHGLAGRSITLGHPVPPRELALPRTFRVSDRKPMTCD